MTDPNESTNATDAPRETTHGAPPPRFGWSRLFTVGGMLLLALAAGIVASPYLRQAWHALTTEPAAEEAGLYTCGMHPQVVEPEPGDCPICHMPLVPVADAQTANGEHDHGIYIDPVVVQNIGVRIAPAVREPVTQTLRTVGRVKHAATETISVSPRFEGWVEKLHVEYEGAHVQAGEPLASIYSPKIYAAQQDLLGSADQPRMAAAARERLLNLGMPADQIDTMLEAGEPKRTLEINSPITGHVVGIDVTEGEQVAPGRPLYHLADHRRVWVDLTLHERQMPFVRMGMPAEVRIDALPGRTFDAEVIYIAPHLDPRTRQLTARVSIPTPEHELKPGMFATATLTRELPYEKTLIPAEAVLDGGERKVVLISRGNGQFEPRDVETGIETGDGRVAVLTGVEPGEQVVVSGQFLLDSESRRREALAKLREGDPAVRSSEPSGSGSKGSNAPAPGSGAKSNPGRDYRDDEDAYAQGRSDADAYPIDYCVVTGMKLGSMGEPVVIEHEGRTVKFCCAGCIDAFKHDPERYLKILDEAEREAGDRQPTADDAPDPDESATTLPAPSRLVSSRGGDEGHARCRRIEHRRCNHTPNDAKDSDVVLSFAPARHGPAPIVATEEDA